MHNAVAATASYMHDGSIATLEEAIEHYAAGARGRDNPNKAPNVQGFTLSAAEKRDLIAFLESLTDREFLNNSRLGDPWQR